MDDNLQELIQSYFDCGWEEFESDPKVKELVSEMKKLAEMYLKAKSSKSGDNMVATVAMEAELKRLKAELIEVVENLKANQGEQEDQEVQIEQEDLAVDAHEIEEVSSPKKASASKLPMIGVSLSAVSLVVGAGAFYFATSGNVSKSEFELYKSTATQSVMQDVSSANEAIRAEVDGLRKDLEAFKQELDLAKQELGTAKQEMTDNLAGKASELTARVDALQAAMSKPQKKSPTPALKPKTQPTVQKTKKTKR